MLAYKLKVLHVEDETLKLFPFIHNINVYLRVDKNCRGDSGTVLLYDG